MSVERYHHKGYVIVIDREEDPMNPREEFDNAGKMVCWYSKYGLGDKHNHSSPEDFMRELAMEVDPSVESRIDWWENTGCNNHSDQFVGERVKEIITDTIEKKIIILPLFLYDHSGITMNTSGFSCGWDSGQVGYIYITRKQAVEEWGKKLCTKKVVERATKYLEGEVETYDQFLTGEVYGYRVLAPLLPGDIEDGDNPQDEEFDDLREEISSCWGFFGYDETKEDSETVKDAKCSIECHIEEQMKKFEEEFVDVMMGEVSQ
jgi:hypothetical protein